MTLALASLLACDPQEPEPTPPMVVVPPFVGPTEEGETVEDMAVDAIGVTVRSDCPYAMEVFVGPDPLPEGARSFTLEPDAEVHETLTPGEEFWVFADEARSASVSAATTREGGEVLFSCAAGPGLRVRDGEGAPLRAG